MRYVILGRSIAGISAANAIRRNDPSGEITVISGEEAKPYYRPLIPFLISGQRAEADILYPDDPFKGKEIDSILGTATGVDVKKKEVLLASGERVPFDALLIATGGVPLKPAIPGIDGLGVYPLRSISDAVRIRDAADRAKSAVVIGGGLVGIKAALALRERRISSGEPIAVSVIEILPEVLSGRLDARGAGIVHAALEHEGVSILCGQEISAVVRTESGPSGVRLKSGRVVPADFVVVAAGVRPDIDFLKHSAVEIHRGVIVDEWLRTNIPGIYAAGDIVEGKDLITGAGAVSGIWTNALDMGHAAGANMAGASVKYPAFLSVMSAAEIAGVPFISAGLTEPEAKYETISHADENGYWKFVLSGEFLIGAVFVGNIARAGFYINLIKNRIPIGRIKDKLKKRSAGYVDFVAT